MKYKNITIKKKDKRFWSGTNVLFFHDGFTDELISYIRRNRSVYWLEADGFKLLITNRKDLLKFIRGLR